jgi:hypothetical protein
VAAFRSEAARNSKDFDFRAVPATIQKNCRRKQKVEPLCWHFRGEGHAMDDLEQLVHIAAEGDPNAFVELTRRFQHFAFGSALALLGDFPAGGRHRAGGISGRVVELAEPV